VQSQITALQTALEHNGRITLQSSPWGQMGDCVLPSDVTKDYAFMSLYCGCTSWEQRNGGKQSWDL